MLLFFFFFFNDTATTEIYTLSLHDALPISIERIQTLLAERAVFGWGDVVGQRPTIVDVLSEHRDRKSTRLNSSHLVISYAVFCLKKKKKKKLEATARHHDHATELASGVQYH